MCNNFQLCKKPELLGKKPEKKSFLDLASFLGNFNLSLTNGALAMLSAVVIALAGMEAYSGTPQCTLMDNWANMGYTTKFYIGSNHQEVRMLFDTGSSDMLVLGKTATCNANTGANGLCAASLSQQQVGEGLVKHMGYDSKTSASANNTGGVVQCSYEQGDTNGVRVFDQISVNPQGSASDFNQSLVRAIRPPPPLPSRYVPITCPHVARLSIGLDWRGQLFDARV